jgi:hypothetical protein
VHDASLLVAACVVVLGFLATVVAIVWIAATKLPSRVGRVITAVTVLVGTLATILYAFGHVVGA